MTREQIAYLAGLIDGEGCIRSTRRSEHNRHAVMVGLYIQMASREPLRTIGRWFDKEPRLDSRRKGRSLWRLEWFGDPLLDLLAQVYPLLILKGPQAAMALRVIEIQRSVNPNRGGGVRFPVWAREELDALHLELKRAKDFDEQTLENEKTG